jgi:hypothetical protein
MAAAIFFSLSRASRTMRGAAIYGLRAAACAGLKFSRLRYLFGRDICYADMTIFGRSG